MRITEVTTKYTTGAYVTNTIRGQRGSSTSCSEQAVRRLADRLFPGKVRTVTLLGPGDSLLTDRWRIEADDADAETVPAASASTIAALVMAVLLAACGGGDITDALLIDGPGAYPDCPADPTSFVGPLLAQCFDDAAQRRTILPIVCAHGQECTR